jgi:predicted metal-dependent phosphoesterase TrpH
VLNLKKADLHIHSYFSDGSHSPEELVIMAEDAGLSCIALTDHDTVAGNAELIKAGEKHDFEVIPGIEISSSRGDIVGLFIDSPSPKLKRIIDNQAEQDTYRVKEGIKLMQADGIDITYEEVRELFPHPTIMVQHLVENCIKKGFADDFHGFYKHFTRGGKYRVEITNPSPEESIEAIRESGGAAIFAHPWLNDYDYLFENIQDLKEQGLIAVEEETSSFRPELFEQVTKKIREICLEHDLLITRGTDFHRKGIGATIGEVFCDYSVVEEIKKRLGKD